MEQSVECELDCHPPSRRGWEGRHRGVIDGGESAVAEVVVVVVVAAGTRRIRTQTQTKHTQPS